MKGKKILIVDDEADVLDLLSFNLENEGYEIITAINGKDALEKMNNFHPHLIILDCMMPVMDGFETCRNIRQNENSKDILILFLTARAEDYMQVSALEMGADEYMTKPIKIKVLMSRIKNLFRRVHFKEEDVLYFTSIQILKEKHLVIRGEEEINFPKKEFELLLLLCSKPGKVFTREQIMRQIWGSESDVGDRTIDVHIRKLREKLGDEIIKTIKGVGYKFDD